MDKRVMVFGSYVTDLCGRTENLPAAGETVKGRSFRMGPGGKGSNQAIAAKRAGANVTFFTKLGNDPLGVEALRFYQSEQLSDGNILIDKDMPTGAALIIVNETNAQNQIVVIGSACENITDEDTEKAMNCLDSSDILLLQLETNLEPVRKLLKRANENGVLTVLNPAPAQQLGDEYFKYIDIIIPNETEAQLFTGVHVVDNDTARQAASVFIERGVKKVIVTMGKNGCYACDGASDQYFRITDCGAPVDSTGAGDAFSGGFVAALARGYEFYDAVAYGSCTAGLSVTRHGTAPAMPYREEIDRLFADTYQ